VLRPGLAAVIVAERFLAEIRTTASLQHPHILPLHDSGEADGTVFYVMPFVDGESLRDRLDREHQLPIDDAIRIATQVAAALDYAHRHEVIHRDIKPENILLQDGQALVADFGIALAVSRTQGSTRMTETGLSLGTPRYMAPEQAMGEREITAKADIYSLGCVLYEMLTGEPPFTGVTAQAVIARAMTEQPRSLAMQRHTIQPHVDAAVSTALEKLPADRFTSASDFAAALQNPQYGQRTSGSTSATAERTGGRAPVLVAVLATVTLIAVAGFAWEVARPAPAKPVTRVGLAFAPEQVPLPDEPFTISRDGSKPMYAGAADLVNGKLWIKERGTRSSLARAASPHFRRSGRAMCRRGTSSSCVAGR
jgi:eukaryotic-like serine/threonine-protein kinase